MIALGLSFLSFSFHLDNVDKSLSFAVGVFPSHSIVDEVLFYFPLMANRSVSLSASKVCFFSGWNGRGGQENGMDALLFAWRYGEIWIGALLKRLMDGMAWRMELSRRGMDPWISGGAHSFGWHSGDLLLSCTIEKYKNTTYPFVMF